jgi:hypothetical protein
MYVPIVDIKFLGDETLARSGKSPGAERSKKIAD